MALGCRGTVCEDVLWAVPRTDDVWCGSLVARLLALTHRGVDLAVVLVLVVGTVVGCGRRVSGLEAGPDGSLGSGGVAAGAGVGRGLGLGPVLGFAALGL